MSYWEDAGVAAAGAAVAALGVRNWGHPSIGVALIAFGTVLAAYGLFTGIETAVITGRGGQTTEERPPETASET